MNKKYAIKHAIKHAINHTKMIQKDTIETKLI